MKKIVLYCFDTMAEWEIAYLTGGFPMVGQQTERLAIQTYADPGVTEVTTMGSLRLGVDHSLDDLDVDSVAALVLPGGATWGSGHERVLELARNLHGRGVPVAGICGATVGLARTGLLNSVAHTSNTDQFLGQVPEYQGAEHYVDEPTVSDQGIITAPGAAPVSFAKAIYTATGLLDQERIDAWYQLYLTGESRYFDALMSA